MITLNCLCRSIEVARVRAAALQARSQGVP
jgi:hypothetical protein